MPVKKENLSRYPKEWKDIALAIKNGCDWKCQSCGLQCRRPGEPFTTHKITMSVAHLDHTPENCEADNLRGWCSKCHLQYDAKHHAHNAAATRRKKAGITDLFAA
jgi:hypothetical protein